jgi:flavin-binding protein dodecin
MSAAATSAAREGEKATTKRSQPAVAKIVEIIGISNKGWEDAAQVAIDEAKKTIHNIHGIKIQDMTADLDPNIDRIARYKTCVKLSFGVMDEER